MAPVDLEKLVPGLAEQRGQERQNRALAFAGLTHTVCGREILPLTPRHRLTLQLLRNAFTTTDTTATRADIFVFLWVTGAPATWTFPGRQIAWKWLQSRLRRHVATLDLGATVTSIYRYLVDQLQDSGGGSSGDGKDQSAWVHWMAADATFWMIEFGFTLEQYQRTPYLVLQQLYRAWQCSHPDIERTKDGTVFVRDPIFVNASDKLARGFFRDTRDRMKAWHLAQKERRN